MHLLSFFFLKRLSPYLEISTLSTLFFYTSALPLTAFHFNKPYPIRFHAFCQHNRYSEHFSFHQISNTRKCLLCAGRTKSHPQNLEIKCHFAGCWARPKKHSQKNDKCCYWQNKSLNWISSVTRIGCSRLITFAFASSSEILSCLWNKKTTAKDASVLVRPANICTLVLFLAPISNSLPCVNC